MKTTNIQAFFSKLQEDAEMQAEFNALAARYGFNISSSETNQPTESQLEELSEEDLDEVSGGLGKGSFKWA